MATAKLRKKTTTSQRIGAGMLLLGLLLALGSFFGILPAQQPVIILGALLVVIGGILRVLRVERSGSS